MAPLQPDIPLYRQIKNRILDMIERSNSTNPMSFSDHSMMEQFGVSRITVRKAIKELVDDGVLYRVQGLGTFVQSRKLTEKLTLTSFLDPWVSGSGRLSVRVADFTKISADEQLAAQLQIAKGDQVTYVKRLRLRGNTIYAIDDRFIRSTHAYHLTVQQIMNSSLVDYLRNREGIKIVRSTMDIEGKSANKEEADQLGILKGQPLLVRKAAFFDERDVPILVGTSIYRADLIKYRITLSS